MYFFTPDTIIQANKRIEDLDPKVGGLFCILSCLEEEIDENISYTIDGERLRKQLSFVFDKEPRDTFDGVKSSYIIFAKGWITNFFENIIRADAKCPLAGDILSPISKKCCNQQEFINGNLEDR